MEFKEMKDQRLTLIERHGTNHYGAVLWLCQCICGKQSIHVGWQVRAGKIKSCGCSRFNKRKLDSPLKSIFRDYIDRAKNKNLSFEISLSDFKNLISSNCHYCGSEPIIRNRKGEIKANGVDRVDSAKGYYLENCVPCCKICNMAKNNMDQKEFVQWIKKLIEFNT